MEELKERHATRLEMCRACQTRREWADLAKAMDISAGNAMAMWVEARRSSQGLLDNSKGKA